MLLYYFQPNICDFWILAVVISLTQLCHEWFATTKRLLRSIVIAIWRNQFLFEESAVGVTFWEPLRGQMMIIETDVRLENGGEKVYIKQLNFHE